MREGFLTQDVNNYFASKIPDVVEGMDMSDWLVAKGKEGLEPFASLEEMVSAAAGIAKRIRNEIKGAFEVASEAEMVRMLIRRWNYDTVAMSTSWNTSPLGQGIDVMFTDEGFDRLYEKANPRSFKSREYSGALHEVNRVEIPRGAYSASAGGVRIYPVDTVESVVRFDYDQVAAVLHHKTNPNGDRFMWLNVDRIEDFA